MPIQLKWSLILVALLVCLAVAADWVADLLWFETLGYTSVFWRIRLLKVGLFVSGFLLGRRRAVPETISLEPVRE